MRNMADGTCFVLDIGSSSIKAGFGGEESPKIFSNIVGSLKGRPALPGMAHDDEGALACEEAHRQRGLLKLAYPMTHGHITDWPGFNRVTSHIYNALGISPHDHPVLVTEAAFTSRPQRYRIAQRLLEELGHPGVAFGVQGLMSLYAHGHTTGLVLDVGDGVMHACPVYDGFSIREAARRVDFGGRDVTEYLQMLLRQNGVFLDTSAEFDVVRQIKEQRCSVSTVAVRSFDDVVHSGSGGGGGGGGQKSNKDSSAARAARIRHRLPDGTDIEIGEEQTLAPEALFHPALVGRECSGVVGVASESIRKCDIDLRRDLYGNIFLAGGCTLFANFCNRFLAEMTKHTPKDCKVRLMASGNRTLTAWIGASSLTQLPNFKDLLVKKSDFLEEGERILHSKVIC